MTELSFNEQDLLQRIDEKKDLRPLFFRKVKGLKWFNALYKRGYFNPEKNPKPVKATEEGYTIIPNWPVLEYLVKTAPELSNKENIGYIKKYIDLLVGATNHARVNNYNNYRTWWRFSEIISYIPSEAINLEDIEIIDYWLEDKSGSDLVAQEIGEKWLPKLLKLSDGHSLKIATKLIKLLYKVIFVEQKFNEKINCEAKLRFDNYIAKKINIKVADLAGEKLGPEAIAVFDEYLKYILVKLNNDSWSYIWQPAIDEHEQNKHKDEAENIIIYAYRDSLNGYLKIKPEEASKYIERMLKEEYQTIHRLALYAINRNFYLFHNFIDELIKKEYLGGNYRYEIWHLLNCNYQKFNGKQKKKVLELILSITRTDDVGKINEGATAYSKARWLAAIKDHGNEEKRLYKENVEIAKAVPDHPDFSSYMSVGWVADESPIPIEELQALSLEQLIKTLETYKSPDDFFKPTIEGLTKTFKQIIKVTPLRFYNNLVRFSELDLAYVYEIIEAYRELWIEKVQLPWDEIWSYLLDFCLEIIKQVRFWDLENKKQRKHFVANRYWIVSGIGRLLKAGTESDDHAFSKEYFQKSEDIITYLLEKEEGDEYKIDSDAVFISINSPRGHCLEALINLTLRSCRLSDKNNNKDHSAVWTHFQTIYDSELNRADIQKPEYEFATLITMYLPNFFYMSKEWLMGNLGRIFDQGHYLKWVCAMQGYGYVNTVYQEVYQYLKDCRDFIKALDDKNINNRIKERVIENIAISYIDGFEKYSDKNSLIRVLVLRKKIQELNHLIWFIWTLQKRVNEKLTKKVYELWPEIHKVINVATIEGKKIASQLCLWSIFVDPVDKENRQLLLEIVPYAAVSYHSHTLLESIANISQTQPFEAYSIWMKMLEYTWETYPEQAIRQILTNLVKQGPEGLRKAKNAVSEYLKRGSDLPNKWLREIRKDLKNF
jgi:hypothetical protein